MNVAQAGGESLVLDHLALVGYHVNEVLHRVPPSVSRDDLASAGSVALVLAARSFDPDCGVPFVDVSRPGRRRWCEDQRCGDRARQKAFRDRRRAAAAR